MLHVYLTVPFFIALNNPLLMFENILSAVGSCLMPRLFADGCAAAVNLLQALTTLVKSFPKQLSRWLEQLLPPVWNTLIHSADTYP